MSDETLISERLTELLAEADSETNGLLTEFLEAAQDVAGQGREATMARVIHRVFERSVAEFFTMEPVSTQLPAGLVHYTLPAADTIRFEPLEPPEVGLAEVLEHRRSVRSFDRRALTMDELGGVLGTAAGRNGTEDGYGIRGLPLVPYPSIGGLDSNELGVVVNNVEGIPQGYYRYDGVGHGLELREEGDLRLALVRTTFETEWIFYAPVVLILNNCQPKVNWKYKTRGYRISHIDQGALLQTIYLSAVAHGLAGCAVAGFFDEELNQLLGQAGTDQFVSTLMALGAPMSFGERPSI